MRGGVAHLTPRPLPLYASSSSHFESPRLHPRPPRLAAEVLLVACRIEYRPPTGVGQSRATVQGAVTEHYRARTVQAGDTVLFTVLRRQVDTRRDLATACVTVRESRHLTGGRMQDTTLLEQL